MGTQLIAANNKKRENAPRISSYIYEEPRIFARAHVYFDFEMIYREWISNNLNASELFFSLPLFSFRQIGDGKKKTEKRDRPRVRSLDIIARGICVHGSFNFRNLRYIIFFMNISIRCR